MRRFLSSAFCCSASLRLIASSCSSIWLILSCYFLTQICGSAFSTTFYGALRKCCISRGFSCSSDVARLFCMGKSAASYFVMPLHTFSYSFYNVSSSILRSTCCYLYASSAISGSFIFALKPICDVYRSMSYVIPHRCIAMSERGDSISRYSSNCKCGIDIPLEWA